MVVAVQCCCGISLQSGTQIIGWLQMVPAILMSFGTTIVLSGQDSFFPVGGNDTKTNEEVETLIRITLICILVYCFIQVVVSALLLVGVSRRSPGLMMPWIVFTAVVLFMLLFSLFSIQTILFGLLTLAMEIYFMLVVLSHRRELKGERMGINIVTANAFPNAV